MTRTLPNRGSAGRRRSTKRMTVLEVRALAAELEMLERRPGSSGHEAATDLLTRVEREREMSPAATVLFQALDDVRNAASGISTIAAFTVPDGRPGVMPGA